MIIRTTTPPLELELVIRTTIPTLLDLVIGKTRPSLKTILTNTGTEELTTTDEHQTKIKAVAPIEVALIKQKKRDT